MNTIYYSSIYEEKQKSLESIFKFYNWEYSNLYINLKESEPYKTTLNKDYLYTLETTKKNPNCIKWTNNFYKDLSTNKILRAFKLSEDESHAFNSNMNMLLLQGHSDLLNPISLTNIKVNTQDKSLIFLEYEEVQGNYMYIYIYILSIYIYIYTLYT